MEGGEVNTKQLIWRLRLYRGASSLEIRLNRSRVTLCEPNVCAQAWNPNEVQIGNVQGD